MGLCFSSTVTPQQPPEHVLEPRQDIMIRFQNQTVMFIPANPVLNTPATTYALPPAGNYSSSVL